MGPRFILDNRENHSLFNISQDQKELGLAKRNLERKKSKSHFVCCPINLREEEVGWMGWGQSLANRATQRRGHTGILFCTFIYFDILPRTWVAHGNLKKLMSELTKYKVYSGNASPIHNVNIVKLICFIKPFKVSPDKILNKWYKVSCIMRSQISMRPKNQY